MAESKETVWNFEDLGFFLGAIVPSYLLAGLLTGAIPAQAARGLTFQGVLYILMLSVLYVLARLRHGVPFAESVNWTMQFRGAWYCLLGAPVLALFVSALGGLLGAPLMPTAVDTLTAEDIPLPVVAVFAVILGPIFEELVFRGFLQPLFQRGHRAWRGIIITSGFFSLLHGAQSAWQWQYLLLLFIAGLAFGITRQRTGSTAAAFLLHMGFNLTPMASAILSRG